ncbi:dynamin family protein [Telluria beijingensis]|uniref:dynamin family protein n=1 Tax=Telluria beijingensis TaxID=3068633 RepID=UPI0027957F46|nr:dynamin family protein [Massilia sp. REN29]
MMIDANSEALNSGLRARQNKISQAQDYLVRTQELFDGFGSPELKASHARFAELARALESDRTVLLVVVGEFSRGKSSLVNALMGIELLRYAKEATTAVNTFIKALPPGRSDKFIKVHFLDGRPAEELEWTDSATLERWSTELDESHADARRQVDHIEIFMAHPLLEQGLVLIDTPGLQSLVEHHEVITRKAIAEAHIAIWVQSALQLGGNATEWKFLDDTICRNFSKFITVVNMWDEIIESRDAQDIGKSERKLTEEKLGKVKANFRKYLAGQPEAHLEAMTDADHLMGVSALWALSDNASKRERSGVPQLASCIRDMFSSGEALEQVYRKPLKQLLHIQQQLAASVDDEQAQLNSTDSLDQRQRDLDLIEQELKGLELELSSVTSESRVEHERAARFLAAQIEEDLTVPLANLKAEIEEQLTAAWVESQVAKKVRKIALPAALDAHFGEVMQQVEAGWQKQRGRIADSLEGMREAYADKMAGHAAQLNKALGAVDITLDAPDVAFELDLSPLEDHHARASELEQAIAEHEQEIEDLEAEILRNRADPLAIERAQANLVRAQQRVDRLGPMPSPETRTKSTQVSEGGMYSSAKYQDITYTDTSNVDAWRENIQREEAAMKNEKEQLAAIVEEERRRSGVTISLEAAKRKYDRKVERFMEQKAEAERNAAQARNDVVAQTLERLRRATVGQLDQRIAYLRGHLAESIHALYDRQLQMLGDCVQEQFVEPLNAKRAQREAVQQLMEQGREQVERRLQQLADGKAEIAELMMLTEEAGTQ